MDLRAPDALAAIFPTARDARLCASRLEEAGFATPWTARTQPKPAPVATSPTESESAPPGDAKSAKPDGAEAPEPPAPPPIPPPARNDVTQTSDGVLGAIGRFFSGEGNALRRSLEDHGVDPDVAAAIDATIATTAVVLVVDAAGRHAEAAGVVRASGGRIADATAAAAREPDAAVESDAGTAGVPRDLAGVDADAVAALEREEDLRVARAPEPQRFYERGA